MRSSSRAAGFTFLRSTSWPLSAPAPEMSLRFRIAREAPGLVVALFGGVGLLGASPASADSTLYLLESGGDGERIHTVDTVTGAATLLTTLPDLSRTYRGLSSRAGEPEFLYTVSQLGPSPGCAPRVEQVEIATGAVSSFAEIESQPTGLPTGSNFCALGLAISPSAPGIAWISGVDFDLLDVTSWILSFDLITGQSTGTAVSLGESTQVSNLSYDSIGNDLYAIEDVPGLFGALATLDPLTGVLTPITASPEQSLHAIAFRPEDTVAFSLQTGTLDRLVTLDTATGQIDSVIGPFGVIGPEALAFSASDAPEATSSTSSRSAIPATPAIPSRRSPAASAPSPTSTRSRAARSPTRSTSSS